MTLKISNLRETFNQIYAIAEKDIKLELRFKFRFIMAFIYPIIGIIMPIIVMNSLLSYNIEFGPWNSTNFMVYQILAYNIGLINGIQNRFQSSLYQEKIWLTLQALIIAPFKRNNLLFGIFFTHLILISIPFLFFLILCYFYYPITIVTLLNILFLFILLGLLFSGIGLIIGVFAISNESIMKLINLIIIFFFYFSCITYPFQLFPYSFQIIINYNPLYYIFNLIRLVWIEDNILLSLNYHFLNFLLLLIGAIIFPILGIIIFNKIYEKYGIKGY